VRRGDRVLEIGFGPGLAVRELSRIAVDGYVCGIDHSALMLRWRASATLTASSAQWSTCGWAQSRRCLISTRRAELRCLLRPGGLIAVAHQPRGPGCHGRDVCSQGTGDCSGP
jgi:hypothetical protein